MYVFCGEKKNSIERINAKWKNSKWELLQVSKEIPDRSLCGAVATLGGICIFGGRGDLGWLKDVYMLRTETMEMELVKEDTGEAMYPFCFPINYDKKRNVIYFCHYWSKTLCWMTADTFKVEKLGPLI